MLTKPILFDQNNLKLEERIKQELSYKLGSKGLSTSKIIIDLKPNNLNLKMFIQRE